MLGILRELIGATDRLRFDESPDYDHYVSRLIDMVDGKNSIDWVMDWSKTTFMWHSSLHSKITQSASSKGKEI